MHLSIHQESNYGPQIYMFSITEEVGHDFRGMCILLSHIIILCNVLFLLTQRVDLAMGCVGIHCSLW